MRNLPIIVCCLILLGCGSSGITRGKSFILQTSAESKVNLPEVKTVDPFPIFAKGPNEVQIEDSFNEIDPTFLIGSLVDVKDGKIYALDNYLIKDSKIEILPLKEIAFEEFVEDSAIANAQWLSFLKGQVNAKSKAEVLVLKSSKVTTPMISIDVDKLKKELNAIPIENHKDFGLIIGYIDCLLSASMFRDYGTEGRVSGSGAHIGATWYSKAENLNSEHRLIAIWSPLTFIARKIAEKTLPGEDIVDLDKATKEAIIRGQLKLRPVMSLKITND